MKTAESKSGSNVREESFGKLTEDLKKWWEIGDVTTAGELGGQVPGFNRVVLVGALTEKPKIRSLPSGSIVGDLNLAVTEAYTDRKGTPSKSTCFVDLVAWGKVADACGQYLEKGSPVLVEGRLQLDRWETDKGEKRSKIRVRADRVRFLGRPARDGGGKVSPGPSDADAVDF